MSCNALEATLPLRSLHSNSQNQQFPAVELHADPEMVFSQSSRRREQAQLTWILHNLNVSFADKYARLYTAFVEN